MPKLKYEKKEFTAVLSYLEYCLENFDNIYSYERQLADALVKYCYFSDYYECVVVSLRPDAAFVFNLVYNTAHDFVEQGLIDLDNTSYDRWAVAREKCYKEYREKLEAIIEELLRNDPKIKGTKIAELLHVKPSKVYAIWKPIREKLVDEGVIKERCKNP